MTNQDFAIQPRPGTTLGANLNTWKLFADQFYRASECLLQQVRADMTRMVREHLRHKAGSPFSSTYQPTIDHVYFLTIGYCLENMMKGIIIFQDPDHVANGKLSRQVKSHDLARLAKLTGVIFSDDEQRFFDFITPSIKWYGKYPIPTKAEDSIGSSNHSIEEVRKHFLNIYRKLSLKMESTGKLKVHLHSYGATQ